MKIRSGLPILLAFGLAASNGAFAACDVTLISLVGTNAALKATCGAGVTGINWLKNGTSINVPAGDIAVTGTPAELYVNTTATATSTFSATANAGAIAAGTTATVTVAPVTLIVTPSAGGTVASTPSGITGCTSAAPANCVSTFTFGTSVVLTATPDSGHGFSGWGSDCTGTGTCTVSMTAGHAVSAAFGDSPVAGACGTAHGVAIDTAPVANLCANGTSAGTVTDSGSTFTWTCSGINGSTSNANCSAPDITNGACGSAHGGAAVTTAPTGAAACSAGTLSNQAAVAPNFTWTCTGENGGTSPSCSVAMQAANGACGTANGTNVAGSPTGTAACSAGTSTTPVLASNAYTWTCNHVVSGTDASCSANLIVNGACGSASGSSSSTAPTTNLCSTGTATAVAGTGPWTWGCNGINSGTSTSATACSASVGVSCPTPAAGTLTYTTVQNDNYTSTNFHVRFNAPGMSLDSKVLANTTKAYEFRNLFNPASKAKGFLTLVDGNAGGNKKDIAISECPGVFTGLPLGCSKTNVLTTTMYWTNDGNKYDGLYNACAIDPAKTYYFNIRPNVAGQYAGYAITNN